MNGSELWPNGFKYTHPYILMEYEEDVEMFPFHIDLVSQHAYVSIGLLLEPDVFL
jgi:hypothetical protein